MLCDLQNRFKNPSLNLFDTMNDDRLIDWAFDIYKLELAVSRVILDTNKGSSQLDL